MFFLPRNLVNIGLAITILGILAMAQTVVIVSGGLDISVGSIVGLATMVVAITMQSTGSAALGIGAALGAAALAGLANGLIITYGRVNAVIATLGTMAAFRGFAFLTSGGSSVSIVNEQFRFLGNGVLLFFPVPILVLLAVLVAVRDLPQHHRDRPQHLRHRRQPDRGAARRHPDPPLPDRHLHPLRHCRRHRRPPAGLAHHVRPAGLGQPGPGAGGDHRGDPGRLRACRAARAPSSAPCSAC